MVKQAVTYATLTVIITLAYAGSLVLLGLALPAQVVRASPIFNVAFVVLIAFLFQPLRARVQHGIDRLFYRSRLDYRQTVGDVAAALTSMLDLETVLTEVGRTVGEGLHLERLTVLLWLDGETQRWQYNPQTQRMEAAGSSPRYEALRAQLARHPTHPWLLADPDAAPGAPTELSAGTSDDALTAARAEMIHLGAVVFLPLILGRRLLGGFALGPRRASQRFRREDIALLRTLSHQSAIAIHNAQSYGALQTLNTELEAKVQARTAELEGSNAELAQAYRDLQTAQTQLIQTEKLASLGQLAAGVAHEINNPVGYILSNLTTMGEYAGDLLLLLRAASEAADRHAGGGDAREALERLGQLRRKIDADFILEDFQKAAEESRQGAVKIRDIVRSLREFSHVDEGELKPSDINVCLEEALRICRNELKYRADVRRDFGDLPRVPVYPQRLEQVFINLLMNAAQAIQRRGEIVVSTRVEGDEAVVRIRDTGTGIPPEHMKRLFEPFFTTKPVGKGTGLGLHVAYKIARVHDGRIDVSSEPGRGTEVAVRLPLAGPRGPRA